MTEPVDLPPALVERRRLLSRGAVVAGAAVAGAAALTVAGAAPAAATNGQALTQGGTFTGGSTTTLGGGSSSTAALRLQNASGPALQLASVGVDFSGDLAPGQMLAIDDRFVVGAKDSIGNYTTALSTVDDINSLSLPSAIDPERLVDTRSTGGRAKILNKGSLDSSGRLKAGSYIDVVVDDATRDYVVDAVFLNLTSTGSTANGFLSAYPPGPKPSSSSLNYTKGVAIANFSLVRTGVSGTSFVVRVYSSSLTHVIIDLTGGLVSYVPGPAAQRTQARTARRSVARRVQGWSPARRR